MSDTAHSSPDLADGVTLDALFRANVGTRGDRIAIADPANRSSFTDGGPRRLTYAELDARVERLAQMLQSFGMPLGSAVAVQLPNIVESAVSLLGILRAGYVAVPVPMLWRRSDLVAALAGIAPKASISLARLNDERPAETLCEAAAELFELSFPCAFGIQVPDGVVPLEGSLVMPTTDAGPAGSGGISLVTFDADPEGHFAVGRTDAQWLAAGLAVLLEAKFESGDTIVSTLPFNSLAGIAAAFVPWLLSGGTLQLVHGHAPEILKDVPAGSDVHLISPAAALNDLAKAAGGSLGSVVAVHRSPASHGLAFETVACERIVDLFTFGETGAVPLVRWDRKHARTLPVGEISAPSGAAGAPTVAEARQSAGQVWLRGPMVPKEAYPPGLGSFRTQRDGEGFVRTGFRCHSDGNGGLIVEAGPDRVISVGGLRFGLNDLQSRFTACGGGIRLTAIEDPLLGQRLHVEADDRRAAAEALLAAGHSPLIVDAAIGREAKRSSVQGN